MPSAETILAGRAKLAIDWQWLATVFHVYFAALIVLIAVGAPVSRRLAGILLSIPLVSVSAMAWVSANPFTGTLIGAAAIVLIVLSIRLPGSAVQFTSVPVVIAGFVLLAFGWVYPHFLNTGSFVPYLYSAPMGVIPCPTLSAVIGMALALGALESRPWGIVLAAVGLFYGFFGTLRLGVQIDWVLAAGAAGLLVFCLVPAGAPAKKAAKA